MARGEVVSNGLPGSASARMTEIELAEPDFLKFSELARRRRPAASLSEATGGVLERSARHRELKRPNGFGDELRAALVGDTGVWGGLTLLREAGRAPFAPGDASLVASVSPALVEGLQRSMLLAGDGAGERRETGLLLLADDLTVETADAVAAAWLAELGGAPPPAIGAVAIRARAIAAGRADGHAPASARVRTASGRWLLVRASLLGDRTAVIIEPARSPELAPLIAEAHGLTGRERAITSLVAQGLPTGAIAARLHLSPYTVQDHLKAIFDKLGVGTRGELVARLFFEHYAPHMAG